MPGIKEIRTKIKSVQNTRKITKAMEMVAASKMRKAQERMRASRPYAIKVREIAAHLMEANPEYRHPYLTETEQVKAIGMLLVTTDKGLCGGLNTNVARLALNKIKDLEAQGVSTQITAFGNKGASLVARARLNLVSQETQLGDVPVIDRLLGALKVQLDDYLEGRISELWLATTRFINTMRQEPVCVRLLPLPQDLQDPFASQSGQAQVSTARVNDYGWDYEYEPDAKSVIDALLERYVQGMVFQAVAENMASEQSARMVAMKAATDNAKTVIGELQLVYNKTRQAAITKEISEIVGGAAAV